MITHSIIFLVLAAIFGFFLTWSVGANGLANIMSATLSSKAITAKQAIVIAVIFEVMGAVFGGGGVAKTIQHGIIDTNVLNYPPEIFIYGMLAVLLASACWMTFASYIGMPVSITNAIVGALLGFGLLVLGPHAVYWKHVEYIALSWVISPSLAGIFAYILFLSIQRSILTRANPLVRSKNYISFYLFLAGFVLSEITVIKTLTHFGVVLGVWHNVFIASVSGVLLVLLGYAILRRLSYRKQNSHHSQFENVEKKFALLVFFTTCSMIYAHGANDIAIAVGPIAAIASLIKTGHAMHNGYLVHSILALGALVVVIGLLTYGHKIISTVGSGITALTPSRAYSATLAASTTVIISTSIGIPVSATQTLVGAILGVGLARGIGALDLRVIRNIFTSWIITLPVAAGLTALFFSLIRHVFQM